MWDMLYKGEKRYRLALYSPLGTLEACLSFQDNRFMSCGGKGPSNTEILRALPPVILTHLPQMLLGHLPLGKTLKDTQGRTIEAHITIESGPWTIFYQHYLEEEGILYPTLVKIKGRGATLKIRIEEMRPNWTPSAG